MRTDEKALHIGLASADITPPAGVEMAGYRARQAEAVGHHLRAEALVCLGEEGKSWALVCCDLIGFPGEISSRVRAAMGKAAGLEPSSIILAGTHTHSGPATVAFGRGEEMKEVDRIYLEGLEESLVSLVKRARDDAKPGTFEVAWSEADDLIHNRRVRNEDGSWGNEWEDADGNHPGYTDPSLLLVAVRRPGGKLEAIIVNYGCHPVTLGPSSLEISGDYVSYLKDRIEAETGVEQAMFATAACGNINPRICIRSGEQYPKAMGEALAGVVLEALEELQPIENVPVAAHSEPWSIVRTRDGKKGRGNAGDTTEAEVMAVRAGELVVIAAPGEVFSEFNAMLRGISPAQHVVVVTLANQYPGYIPTDKGQEQGAYETAMAPCENLEQALLGKAAAALAKVNTAEGAAQ